MGTRALGAALCLCLALHAGAGTLVGPSFVREPPSRVDFANETGALVECVAAGSPAPAVGWLTADGRAALPLAGVRLLLTNGSLLFPPFAAGSYRHDVHAATYRCVAANPAGKIVSRDVRVQAVVLQHFDVQLYYNKNVWMGNTAVLRCTIPSFVREFISVTSWLKDSAFNIYPSLKGDGKLHMLPTGELLVRHVDDSDRYRWYQCRAVNRLTGLTTLSAGRAKFSVSDPGIVSAPRPLEKQVSINVRKDQPIVLPCFAEAHPPPTQRWYRQERHALQEVTADERVFPVGDGLAIAHADESDSGQWVCVVSNSAGEQRVDVSVHVAAPLSVSVQPATKLTADVGSAASLRCLVAGAPASAVTWLKDGAVLAAHGDTLALAPVRREDAGMYQCLVRADGDSAQAAVQLQLGAAKPQLVYKFINQTVQPGPAVSLKCIATGNPTPHITWRLDGFPLPHSDRFVIGQYVTLHGDVISHVNISNVAVEDGGIYSCTASNRVGEVTHSADMRVYGLPFVRPMPNVSAVAGEPLYIACPVSGYPIETITWEKDRRRLPVTRRQKVFSNGTLLLENVQKDTDRGLYRCTATNKQGHSSSQTLPLTVTVPPRIGPFSFGDLIEGERAQVQCVIQAGDPPLTLHWLKDGAILHSQDGINLTRDTHSSTLAIAAVHRSHAGNYTCVASNAAKSALASAQLTVSVPPRWIQEPVDRNVTRDETVMFDCQAEGFPVPTVVWRKAIGRQPTEYQDLSTRNHGVQIFSNGSLLIQHALPEHAGQYMCEATNGIGAGLSAVVVLTVHIPPQFEVRSSQASIRKGASQILQCEARGDTPMTIEWLREGIRLPAHLNPRYEVKESVVKGGFLSELHISSTDKGDSGIYICIAQNKYGRAERTVHLQVQDAPGKPQDVRVVDTTSRSVKIAWLAPSDDRSPVLKYIAQYKPNTSPGDNWHSVAAGSELTAEVSGLLPATLYQFRVVAENDLGLGEHSDPVLLQTDGEAPAGEPQGLSVTAVASDQLKVLWSPPLQHMWNGNILGYYIGYREHSSSRQTSYTYTTVSEKGPGPYSTVLSGLKKYRKYGVVVQAFNEKGPGPMSPELIAQTLEDVPSAAPLDVKCAAKGPQVIFLTWQPPPLFSQNGLIQGYKVYYENMNEWPPGQIEAETVVTNELATELHGLQKFANYSLQIWAYTRAGDGVKSSPVYCRTEEDVPGSPANIKVLSSSPTSLVVSWMKPVHPNGHLVSYTLYSRILEGGREKDSSKRRLSPAHTHYELHDLRKEEEYEFWVTAFTKVGEGQSTRVVYASVSSRVPAAIVSFGDTVSVRRRGSVQLPCLAVGIPSPERSWTAHDNPVTGNAFSIQHDGTLHINDVQKHHEENYTCTVSNSEGEDHISYFLQVLVAPSAPLLQVSGTSTSWIQLRWNPVKNGGSAVRGYLLNFRKEGGGEWEERLLPRDATLYQLQGLTCGTEYHLQLFAFNSIGSGAPSELLVVRTNGSRPVKPNFSEFISVNITTVILNFKSWKDNGCPIISFGVEYRESSQQDWITAGNNLAVREHFPVMGLWPGTTYIFRITSTNSAGTTSGEYRIVTQSALSGNLVPDQSNIHVNDVVPFYMDVAVILPVLISIITLIAVFVGVCIFFHRKPGAQAEGQSQPMVTLDNKHNIAQREQYYAAVQKGATSHSSERIPEFAEDISPYATFHVPNQPSSPAHIQTFVYHDHHLAAMETMKLKSSNPQDDYTKLRGSQKSKCARSESSDYSSSTAHRSDAGPVAIPIHTSTRNDIDGLSLQTILYQGGGIGPESSTSPEPSPLPDRRNVTRRQRHNVSLRSRRTRAKSVHRRSEGSRESHVDPPTSFSDGHELSEAECDMDTIRHYKWAYKGSSSRDNSQHGQSYNNFTIAV